MADHYEEQPGHDAKRLVAGRFQRHIENLVQEHLRTVADDLSRQIRRRPSQQVVVVCAEEIRNEFSELPSTEAPRNAVVGWTQAEAHASPADILAIALPEPSTAASDEYSCSSSVPRGGGTRRPRVLGVGVETLEAASDGRVELLLSQHGSDRPAWQCPECGRASLNEAVACSTARKWTSARRASIAAVHQTLAHGGRAGRCANAATSSPSRASARSFATSRLI